MVHADAIPPDTLPASISERWPAARAWQWMKSVKPLRGFNYLPRTAVNTTEMWQAETFDPGIIAQELDWAQATGYNSARVFLQYLVWQHDPHGFLDRLNTFLILAHERGVSIMPILFDDCAFCGKEPYLGPQDDPVPGVHNSGWTPSPGLDRVVNRECWPDLQRYVQDVVGAFANDARIIVWDVYNEPGNSHMGEKSLPLVEAAFVWARVAKPAQPLTAGAWVDYDGPMSRRLVALSDVVSFHNYETLANMERVVTRMEQEARPVLCTEWLRRTADNTVASILPLFAAHNIGWYQWGLVAGRTQTYLDWTSKAGDPLPDVWQHDLFHADGTPYDPDEIAHIKAWPDAAPVS